MMRTHIPLTTTVRPIKKLFVLDPGTVDVFLDCVCELSEQVGGLYNIFMVNDAAMDPDNVSTFVERHDPDVILNYSSLPNDALYARFRRQIVNGLPRNGRPKKFGCPLFVMSNHPMLDLYAVSNDTNKHVFINKQSGTSPESLFAAVHCGLVHDDQELLADTLFQDRPRRYVESWEYALATVNDRDLNLLYLTADPVNAHSYQSNVWQPNYNTGDLFSERTKTICVSAASDLNGLVYFWNTRATYPFADLLWMPVEFGPERMGQVGDRTHCCAFGEKSKALVGDLFVSSVPIDVSRFYFPVIGPAWKEYRNETYVGSAVESLLVSHPFDKLPSKHGMNCGLMVDIQGPEEFFFPRSHSVGKAFGGLLGDDARQGKELARVGPRGLSLYVESFRPFETADYVREITLYPFSQLLGMHFADFGLTLKRTDKTTCAEQCLSLFQSGGCERLITEKNIFDGLRALTPPRGGDLAESLKSVLAKNLGGVELKEELVRTLEKRTTYRSSRVVYLNDLVSIFGGQRDKLATGQRDKMATLAKIEFLYDANVLLRGKRFDCPRCGMELWFNFANLDDVVRCYCCNREIRVPTALGDSGLPDAYRLNELVARAVDQGILTVLVARDFFFRERFLGICFDFCTEVSGEDNTVAFTDIDIVVKLGNRLGVGEVKTGMSFDANQTNKLLDVATRVCADFVVFAALSPKNSKEVQGLKDDLLRRKLNRPTFILTEEVLFGGRDVQIGRFFENSSRLCCEKPIVVADAVN